MKRICLLVLLGWSTMTFGQQKPKLVVGIVVDQMRMDYLYRYWDRFGEGGFKELVNNGASCANAHYNYTPTFTGPGHASIFTGTTPSHHGIVSNDWYDRATKKGMYCVQDDDVTPVGTESKKAKRSPKNLVSSNLADELEMNTMGKSITIAVSLKDRGAILPAGHAGDHAYWLEEGNFATSTWYMNELPKWVASFNKKNNLKKYIKEGWNTLHPIESYTASSTDKTTWEKPIGDKADPTFPYPLEAAAEKKGVDIIKSTPLGNTFLCDFALEALDALELGKDGVTDFMSVSFSSTDYVGHGFAPHAVETEDAYLRLDKDLARLITKVKEKTGDDVVVFLTSDHGGSWNGHHLKSKQIHGGTWKRKELTRKVTDVLKKAKMDTTGIAYCSDGYIYVNEKIKPQQRKRFFNQLRAQLIKEPGIRTVVNLRSIVLQGIPAEMEERIKNGVYQQRVADYQIIFEPGYMEYGKTGTTHGSGYNYDTHVPILFYGKGVKKGKVLQRVNITDIAPTAAYLMGIAYPNACTGDPIRWLVK